MREKHLDRILPRRLSYLLDRSAHHLRYDIRHRTNLNIIQHQQHSSPRLIPEHTSAGSFDLLRLGRV